MTTRHVVIAFRSITRTPVTSLFIVVVLTVSIAASTAIFALADAAILKPLPYPQAERLVTFGYSFNGRSVPRASEAKFVVWREVSRAIEDPTAVLFRRAELGDRESLQHVQVGVITAGFFRLFGMPLAIGRPFTDEEATGNGGEVVVLSRGFWQRQFGGDHGVIGRQVVLDGQSRTVVAIAEGFDTSLLGGQPDLWIPLRFDVADLQHPPFLSAYARLRLGVSLQQAHEEDGRAAEEFRQRYPGVLAAEDSFAVRSFSDVALADVRQPLGLLAGAVGLVLVLGCINVAGLLLVQMAGRRRELAVRTALGASRRQIAAQLLTENLCLATVAAGVGAILGLSGARALVALAPTTVPRLVDGPASLTFDGRFGAFMCLMVLAITFASTVVPMLASKSMGLADLLRGDARTVTDSPRTQLARAVVVMSQIALATILTTGATLLGRTWWNLQSADRGFNLESVATMRTSLANAGDALTTDRVAASVDTVADRLRTVPGVVGAAATCCLPLESDWLTSFEIVGRGATEDARRQLLSERRVSPSYFELLEIPVVRGRAFDARDREAAPQVAVISQTMARQLWAGQDPIGALVQLFPGTAPDENTRDVPSLVSSPTSVTAWRWRSSPGPRSTSRWPRWRTLSRMGKSRG